MSETMNTTGLRWQLRELLEAHDLTAYRLAQQLHGTIHESTVYALVKGDRQRVELSTLAHVLAALEAMTGQRFTVADLLAYQPEQRRAG